jgi:hypothetical protein
VGIAMAFACARAVRLDSSMSALSCDASGLSSLARGSIHADIFMTDLAEFVDAAHLTLLQNKSHTPSPSLPLHPASSPPLLLSLSQ